MFGRIALGMSILLVAVVTLTPRAEYVSPRFDWRLTSNPRELAEGFLNIVLFVPFGAALRWLGARLSSAILLGFLFSLAVELLQRYVIPGREGELQDLIANTLGALLGWLLARTLQRSNSA
jgi:glycopeptide antibiotics resistance protein